MAKLAAEGRRRMCRAAHGFAQRSLDDPVASADRQIAGAAGGAAPVQKARVG